MSYRARNRLLTALGFIGIGILFAFLPTDWIEFGLGIAPDNSNGFAEFLFVLIPAGIGIALAADVLVRNWRRGKRSAPSRLQASHQG
ncbi:MAG: hypothetical protein ACHQZS_09785 [Candidatus Binatales bacterium]